MTSAAEKVAGEKEVVKRKALGRGLESLLPGPRVVPGPGGGGGAGQVPPRAVGSVRYDNVSSQAPAVVAGPDIQAIVDPGFDERGNPVASAERVPALAKDAKDGAPTVVAMSGEGASLREGQPGAAVATYFSSAAGSQAERAGAPAPHEPVTLHAQAESRLPGNLVVNIALDAIDKNPYQTRYLFDREMLQELADSIVVNGVVQPIVVRPAEEEGRYVLILGERRCRASKIAGKTTVPAIVKRVSDQQAAEMTVVENLQRQDLNCVEQAEAFRVLSQNFQLTQQEIGDRVGLSRESVSNYMRLLKLKARTLDYLSSGALSFTDARMLLALEDVEIIANAAEQVVTKHLSGEQIEDLVMELRGLTSHPETTKKRVGARWVDPNVRAAQTELERKLGLRVKIRDRAGKGRIVIEYTTVDDFERVVEMLGK